MRIAILGAGGTGVCAALEIANRGYNVDLYDENSQPMTGASRNNEGKIHLGLVYAKDRSLATAKTMIEGAIRFSDCLSRWIDPASSVPLVSTPFYYAVPRETMTEPADLERHYGECRRLFDDACAATGLSYLGQRRFFVEKVSERELAADFSPEHVLCAYRTSEVAVDVRGIADQLSEAVRCNPRIRFLACARVLGVKPLPSGTLRVTFRAAENEHTEIYDQVANTLWHGRLEIDATAGLAPERDWIFRYKVGGWLNRPVERDGIRSVTFVLGPFGDIVNLGPRGLYFSWYPMGMLGSSSELKPPDWRGEIEESKVRSVLRGSYQALGKLCPALDASRYADDLVEPVGGVIFAWGAADIDEHGSRLHTRYEIGIHSEGNYHSVNTGKYTMVPYLGYRTAERILGIS